MPARFLPTRTVTAASVALSVLLLAGCSTEPGSTDDGTTAATDDAPSSPSTAATTAAPTATGPVTSPSVPDEPSGTPESPLPNSVLEDAFAVLPLPSRATPRDAPVVEGSTMQQTFRVQGDDPEAILDDFFVPELEQAGWNLTEGVEPRGGGAAATWVRDGLELQLVTQPGPDQPEVGLLEVLLRRPG